MKDGSSTRVQTWGDDRTGGDITIRFDNINRVFANDHAFAAISTNGTIISWGPTLQFFLLLLLLTDSRMGAPSCRQYHHNHYYIMILLSSITIQITLRSTCP